MKKKDFILGALVTLLLPLRLVSLGNVYSLPNTNEANHSKMPLIVNPSLNFNNVWAEHNVYSDGRKGMFIHLDFNINGAQGEKCSAVAYFYYENGSPLYNQGGGYRTTDGKVATGKNFSPDYDYCHTKLTLFIPYGEMHLNGTYNLKYQVAIFKNSEQIGQDSDWETFRLTWKVNIPERECLKCGC